MFDGFKIDCLGIDRQTWLEIPELDFLGTSRVRTRELLADKPIECNFRELRFKITPPSEPSGSENFSVRGSLQKFADGQNAGAFSFADVRRAVEKLASDFGIDPRRAALRNLEFGVNVALPVSARDFLRGLVCMGRDAFQPMSQAKPDLGRVIKRQQYNLKIYDKGTQAETGANNLLRVEIHVSKMAFLKDDGIATLADLANREKVEKLGRHLTRLLGEVIFYDGTIDETALSQKDLLRLKDFQNPRWWSGLVFQRRFDQKERFAKMIDDHAANKSMLLLRVAVSKIWADLMDAAASAAGEKADVLTASQPNAGAEKSRCFNRLDERLNHPKTNLQKEQQQQFLPVPKIVIVGEADAAGRLAPKSPRSAAVGARFCGCCGRDISAQKAGSLFCSASLFGPSARRCRDRSARDRRRNVRRFDAEMFFLKLEKWAARASAFWIEKRSLGPDDLPALAPERLEPSAIFGQKFRGIRAVVGLEVVAAAGERLALGGIEARRAVRFFAKMSPPSAPVAVSKMAAQPVKIIRARAAAPTVPTASAPPFSEKTAPPAPPALGPSPPVSSERNGPAPLGEVLAKFISSFKKSEK